MWSQIRDANWRIAYVGGWCLKYVQDAFGTDHPYPNAMASWNANYGGGNHPNEQPPAGKTVPVYFALGNVTEGHVAIAMDDGSVASSTQSGSHPQGYIHPNLQDLINIYGRYNGGCTYLGWSEDVGTVHVLQLQGATADQVRQDYLDILERPADDGGIQTYTTNGMSNDQVRADLMASNERKIVVARHEAAQVAAAAAAAQAIADQQAAAAKVLADKQVADAKAAQLADLANQKAAQDAKDAQALIDAQAADAKARAAQATATVVAKLTMQDIFTWVWNFIKSVIGAK